MVCKIRRTVTDEHKRHDLLVEETKAAIARAMETLHLAEAACASARAILDERVVIKRKAATSRLRFYKRTSQLIQELGDASRDLEMLRADIDNAQQKVLAPQLKRRR